MSAKIEQLVEVLQTEIPDAMVARDVPGLAIGICDAGGTIWSRGFGTTARGGETPVTTATRFSVQSTSKLVTATAAMVAVAQGRVELDAPIAEYLPEFAVNSVFDADPCRLITLRHLLSHTAGFTHEAPDGSNHDLGSGDFDAHCASIARTWLRFPVGHHHEYSNLGIDLAGWILQRTGGAPFATWMRRELLGPLGMTRSTFDAAEIEADGDRAIGHWRPFTAAGRPLPVAVPMVAAGGLYTSVDDALRVAALHLRDGAPLLAPELIAEQRRLPFPASPQQRLGYGLGLYVDEWAPGVRVHHHGGSGFGFQAQLCWLPEHEVGVAVLTNSFDHDLQNELSRRIVAHVAGEAGSRRPAPAPAAAAASAPSAPSAPSAAAPSAAAPPTAAPPTAAPSDELPLTDAHELTGQYAGRLDAPLEIAIEHDRLLVRAAGTTRTARLVAPRTIELDGPERERHRFDPGRDGAIAYMIALRDGTARYRNDAAATPPSRLDPGDAGTYVVSSWGVPTARWRVQQDGDSPTIGQLPTLDADDETAPATALRLAPVAPGLYLSSMGEALDLRTQPPTYANVALR